MFFARLMNQEDTETKTNVKLIAHKNKNVTSDVRDGTLNLHIGRHKGWLVMRYVNIAPGRYYIVKVYTNSHLVYGTVLVDEHDGTGVEDMSIAIRRSDHIVETIIHSTLLLKGKLAIMCHPSSLSSTIALVTKIEWIESIKPPNYHQLTDRTTGYSKLYQQVLPCIVQLVGLNGTSIGSATGFFVDTIGHIVTAAHVAKMTQIYAEFHTSDGTKLMYLPTEFIGSDQRADIAVLKLHGDYVTPYLTWVDSDLVNIGSTAVLIGQPQGTFDFSCSKGIVRDNGVYESITAESMKLDAPLTGGNSGGPVLNEQGMCMGIVSYSSKHQNFGGAVPSAIALPIINTIIKTGTNHLGKLLGIAAKIITGVDVVIAQGKYDHLDHVHGIEVLQSINKDILTGDIICKANGNTIGAHRFHYSLFRLVHLANNATIRLSVLRGSKYLTINAKLLDQTLETNTMFSVWC